MGTSRTRTRNNLTTTQGSAYKKYVGTRYRNYSDGDYESCDDVVGNRDGANPFDYRWSQQKRIVFSGDYKWNRRTLRNWPAMNQRDPESGAQYFEELDTSRCNELATEVKAGTNPAIAHVSVPTFIGELGDVIMLASTAGSVVKWSRSIWSRANMADEAIRSKGFWKFVMGKASYKLKDLPYLVWCRGQATLQAIAAGNITWRFGVAPMVSDLQKLFLFADEVDKRVRTLRALQEDGSIRRRMLLGYRELDEFLESTTVVESEMVWLKVRRYVRATENLWASASWHLDKDAVLPQTEHGMYDEALKLTYGITKFELLKALWELTPWSWMADWFSNVSTFLDSYNNSLPVHLDEQCLMQCCTSRSRYELATPIESYWMWYDHTVSDAFEACTTKRRIVLPWYLAYLPSIPTWPALTGGQLSIVGSLATLKMGRWNLRKMFRGVL